MKELSEGVRPTPEQGFARGFRNPSKTLSKPFLTASETGLEDVPGDAPKGAPESISGGALKVLRETQGGTSAGLPSGTEAMQVLPLWITFWVLPPFFHLFL